MSPQVSTAMVTLLVDNKALAGLGFEHGFAAWIEVSGRRVLLDTGQGAVLAGNAAALGIDLGAVDILVLSHGHFDHTGGISQVLARAPAAEVYFHPAATGVRYAVRDAVARSIGMPEAARGALKRFVATRVHRVTEPAEIAPGVGLTGRIDRHTNYEDTGGPFFLDSAGTRPDPISDDLALWIRTDRGLVVVVGCSHAGLINTLQHARRVSGEARLHAVVGGFHLGGAAAERLERTVEALEALAVERIVPCHCTGDAAVETLRQALGARVVPGAAGVSYTFGSAAGDGA